MWRKQKPLLGCRLGKLPVKVVLCTLAIIGQVGQGDSCGKDKLGQRDLCPLLDLVKQVVSVFTTTLHLPVTQYLKGEQYYQLRAGEIYEALL